MTSNTVDNAMQSSMFSSYRSAGPSPDLIVPAAALCAVVVVGIGLNTAVLLVTIKSQSLRGSANFLMALICVFELVHQSGHTLFFFVTFSGINFVPFLLANRIMMPMIFGLAGSIMALFCSAFDRLLAICAPTKHKFIYTQHKFVYLLCHVLICALYGAFVLHYVSIYALENATMPTTGLVAEMLSPPTGPNKYLIGIVVICVCSVCCYIAIFLVIRCKNGVTQKTNTRFLRSLTIILFSNIGGYLFNTAFYHLLDAYSHHIFGSEIRVWQTGFIAGILINVAAGSNAVILYFTSTEYRHAFKKEFRILAKFVGNNELIGQQYSSPAVYFLYNKNSQKKMTIHNQRRRTLEEALNKNSIFPIK